MSSQRCNDIQTYIRTSGLRSTTFSICNWQSSQQVCRILIKHSNVWLESLQGAWLRCRASSVYMYTTCMYVKYEHWKEIKRDFRPWDRQGYTVVGQFVRLPQVSLRLACVYMYPIPTRQKVLVHRGSGRVCTVRMLTYTPRYTRNYPPDIPSHPTTFCDCCRLSSFWLWLWLDRRFSIWSWLHTVPFCNDIVAQTFTSWQDNNEGWTNQGCWFMCKYEFGSFELLRNKLKFEFLRQLSQYVHIFLQFVKHRVTIGVS